MKFTPAVLSIISRSRYGLTAHQIHTEMPDYEGTKTDLQCGLHSMIHRGLVRIDGRKECEGCGSEHVVYRLTDKAKERLAL